MAIHIRTDGRCHTCPNRQILLAGCVLVIERRQFEDAIALETAIEGIADGTCKGCTREEPVAVVSGDHVTINLFPGAKAA